ncbi:MAG: hypothetical protein M1817_006569 [Caeruleum heppii]|nr:MAG: hypothetical protein M1817_006569 [Caeruleum heppii]
MVSPKPSPPRRALHERSDSQTNEIVAPSIRLVSPSDIYTADPYPTQPSQILSPNASSTLKFEKPPTVSPRLRRTKSPTRSQTTQLKTQPETSPHSSWTTPDSPTIGPKHGSIGLDPHNVILDRAIRPLNASHPLPHDGSTDQVQGSSTVPLQRQEGTVCVSAVEDRASDTAANPAPHVPSPTFTRPDWNQDTGVSTATSGHLPESGVESAGIDNYPPPDSELDHSPVSSSFYDAQSRLPSIPSTVSLASTASSETLQGRKHTSRPLSTSFVAFPPAGPLKASKRVSSATAGSSRLPQQEGEGSPAWAPLSPTNPSPRSASSPSYTRSTKTETSQLPIQYPAVRAASAQSSWAQVSPTQQKAHRTRERADLRSRPWSNELSVVSSESEPTPLGSHAHATGGYGFPPGAFVKRSSSRVPYEEGLDFTPESPPPVRPPPRNPAREISAGTLTSQYSQSDEDLRVPPLRTRMSVVPRDRPRGESRDEAREEPVSRGESSIAVAVPNWARRYYSSGGREQLVPPGSSNDPATRPTTGRSGSPVATPQPIRRARNRPRDVVIPDEETVDAISEVGDIIIRGPPTRRVTQAWSPRLQHDRRATTLSVWEAPKLEPRMENNFFSRRSLQVSMFCIGFIFPFAWMIAAFLPLPPKPATSPSMSGRPDIEQALERDVGPIDEMRYANARWWRNLNRVMSVVGLFIIGAIIALVVVAVV